MPIVFAFLIFVAIVAVGSLVGMKMYVRPKEAMERVAGGIDPAEHIPSHPSLAIYELIKRLGNFIPQSPKDVTVMQRRLIRAGVRNENALKILYGAKATCGIAVPLLVALLVVPSSAESGNKIFFI